MLHVLSLIRLLTIALYGLHCFFYYCFRVETMAVNGPANVLVCGHTDGRISLRAVWNLQQTHIVTHSSHGAIKCLWFTEGESEWVPMERGKKGGQKWCIYNKNNITSLLLSLSIDPSILLQILIRLLNAFPSLLSTFFFAYVDYQFLLIGSADGTVSIGTDPDVRWKLLHAAIQKTPLLGPPL